MAKIKTQKKSVSRKEYLLLKVLVTILAVALLSFGAFTGVRYLNNNSDSIKNLQNDKQSKTKPITNNTQTEETEPQDNKTTAGNDNKAKNDELEKEQQKEVERNENGLKKAAVLLNEPYEADGKIIISSMITNIVETEGGCNYIFTNGTNSITKTTNVLPNAKNTVCEAVVLEKGDLYTGEWKVRLEYKSKSSEGVSETQTFTIQ